MVLLNFQSVVGVSTYKPNSLIEISEHTFKVPIEVINVEHYRRIQGIIHHNLLLIQETYLEGKDEAMVNHWKPDSDDLFSPVDECYKDPFFSQFQGPYSNKNFKFFLKSIVDGLVELHKNGLWHGSLNTKTTYFHRRKGCTDPVFRLTGFRYGSGKKKDMMIEDWRALGCMLEDIMNFTNMLWTNRDTDPNFIELKDLCSSMKLNKMGLERIENRYKEAEVMCFVCKEFVLTHPASFERSNRSTYILLACAFLEQNKLWYKITDEDVQFGSNPLDVSSNLTPELISVGAIPRGFEFIEDGGKGLYVVKLERNMLSHVPKPHSFLGTAIGSTSAAVEEYFRVNQPRIVLALDKAVRYTKFKFEELP